MAMKKAAGLSLQEFCNEFGVPDELTIDGSKEQNAPGTEFTENCRKMDIRVTGTEPACPNQNPVEGAIREVRRKWYRTMIRTTRETSQNAPT
jgi:transposase